MRAFVALPLPSTLRTRFGRLREELESKLAGARWVPRENLHLTLRFLGELDEDRVPEVSRGLIRAASETVRFAVAFDALTLFPKAGRPRVLAVGVGAGRDEVRDLNRSIARRLEPAGFAPDEREFSPHVTLARFKGRTTGARSAVAAVGEVELGVMEVSEVILYRSLLERVGPTYQVVAPYPLGGKYEQDLL